MNYNIIYDNNRFSECKIDLENADSLITPISDEVFSSIIGCIHSVGNTVIFDEDDITESDVNWERIFRFTNNYTGYEIGCNEFTIPIEKVENISIYLLAVNFLERLKNKFSNIEFVVYFIVKNQNLEFRFHVFREDEGFWISNFKDIKYSLLCIKG